MLQDLELSLLLADYHRTRPILSGEMAVAYFRSWAPRGFWRSFEQAGMEASILFCFLFLFFWAAGPGAWSVDAWRGKKR